MTNRIKAEVHCHTSACQHAFNTISEMIAHAQVLGLELVAFTDHAPAMTDGVHIWGLIGRARAIPHKIGSLYVLHGAEANIVDYHGKVDLSDGVLAHLDWVIASMHRPCITPGTKQNHTESYIKVLENPYIDALGHSGTPDFDFDFDAVLEVAKRENKAIEINNQTFYSRKKSWENCKQIARRCADLNLPVILSTDAHSIYTMGDTSQAFSLATEAGIREEQIINLNADRFLNYLCNRRGWERARFENTRPKNR